jgi:integrase
MALEKLTDLQVRRAKPGLRTQKLFDGAGLYLEITPAGNRWWRYKYRFAGKEKLISLGTLERTTLKDARAAHREARAALASGIDPSMQRKALKATRSLSAANSFEAIAREWHGTVFASKVSTGHANRTLIRLEQDIFPWLGAQPIIDVKPQQLLAALRRIESRGAIETAHRAKQACGQVFRYAIATGRAEHDPSAALTGALRPVHVEHMAAITEPNRVGELLRAIDAYRGTPITRAALKLAPLVFVRPGELRLAEWAEFDLDGALWKIPSARMKRTKQEKSSGLPHVVPLSRQAVAILQELRPLTGHGRYVFPSLRADGRPMSDNSVLAALRRMSFTTDEMTGHGFRAMARTMLVEHLDVPEGVIEAQLAHAVKDPLGRAYNRTEFLKQRTQMMQVWADYLETLRSGKAESRSTPLKDAEVRVRS